MLSKTSEWLRPSMLPKLALCGRYRSEEMAGEAAQRGTLLDMWFRSAIFNGTSLKEQTEDEAAVNWALDTARALAGSYALDASEDNLRIDALGLEGTADLLCEGGRWSADLKTGQVRNYREQQAAYALGFMNRFFLDEWTVYLLFCDERQLVTLRFTHEEATQCVRSVLAAVHDECQPRLNEYCDWCAARFTCPARKEAAQLVMVDGVPEIHWATSAQLRDFVLRAKIVEEWAEKARAILTERRIGGESIPGVSLISKRGTEKAPARLVELWWKELGTADILAAYGPMSGEKFREMWERKMPDKPFPEESMERMPGSAYIRVSRPKG